MRNRKWAHITRVKISAEFGPLHHARLSHVAPLLSFCFLELFVYFIYVGVLECLKYQQILKSIDKAYIFMKKVPYDVIQKGKKVTKKVI